MHRFFALVCMALLFGISSVHVARAGAQPALTFSRSASSPQQIIIQGHRMLCLIFKVEAAWMENDPLENVAEIPPLRISAFLENAKVSDLVVFPADFDGDMTIASGGVQVSPSEWTVTLTQTGGMNLMREGTTRTYIVRTDILADPPNAFDRLRASFNVEPLSSTQPGAPSRLYIDAKEVVPVGGTAGMNIWGGFPDGVFAVEATIVTDTPLVDAKVTLGSWVNSIPEGGDIPAPIPEGWIIDSNVVGNVIRFSAAGNVPLRAGTWSPFNISFAEPAGISAVALTFESVTFNDTNVTSQPPEIAVLRLIHPIPARFVGDGKVIDGAYALPVGGKAVLKLDAKAPGGLTNLRVGGLTEKLEPQILPSELALEIMPFGGDAEGYHFEGWGNWVADPTFDGIVRIMISFSYESGPLEIRSNGEGPVLQSFIFIVPRYGDGNGDGKVKVADAVLAIKHGGTAAQNKALDVSGNGNVGAFDAALILQCAAGLITAFPVETPKVPAGPTATPVSESKLLQDALKSLQQKAPETLREFEKAGGNIDALAGVTPKGKLAKTWADLKKVAR